jgi:predicted membrane protein
MTLKLFAKKLQFWKPLIMRGLSEFGSNSLLKFPFMHIFFYMFCYLMKKPVKHDRVEEYNQAEREEVTSHKESNLKEQIIKKFTDKV